MHRFLPFFFLGACLSGCQPDDIRFDNNPVPHYEGVSTVVVDAYLTRAYIDLIGREPLPGEMEQDRATSSNSAPPSDGPSATRPGTPETPSSTGLPSEPCGGRMADSASPLAGNTASSGFGRGRRLTSGTPLLPREDGPSARSGPRTLRDRPPSGPTDLRPTTAQKKGRPRRDALASEASLAVLVIPLRRSN